MKPVQLRVRYDGAEYMVDVTEEPLTIGRAPGNGLSLTEPSISWHHATVWVAGGRLFVRDLDSTNGVSLDGVRLRGEAVVPPGATLTLGDRVELVAVEGRGVERLPRVLEDVERGRRFVLVPGTNDLGALGGPAGVTVRVDADGAVTAVHAGDAVPLPLGAVVALGADRVRLVEGARAATVGQRDEPWPYRLTVRLAGPQGPEAELVDRATGARHVVTAENRAVLLYLLARQVRDDLAAGRDTPDLGWCADDDLSVGIWGRGERAASTLPVLVHRLRKELDRAGFDADFLEKGRRVLRARLVDVVVG